MPFFQYNAKDVDGNSIKDKIEAEDQTAALNLLNSRGLFITSIKEVDNSADLLDIDLNFFNKRVSAESISSFLMQLSIMVKCGVSLAEALTSLEHSEDNPYFKKCLEDIRNKVYNGSSLSDALGSHPEIFDKFSVSMIRVGETGGVLDQVLIRLSASSKRRIALKSQIIGALAYPSVLLVVASLVLLALMGFAVPRFAGMFAKSGVELPWATKMLLDIGDFISNNVIGVVVGFFLLVFIAVYYLSTEKGRNAFGELSLKIPVIKEVTRRFFVVQISESMGLLLQAGVPLRELLTAIESTLTMPTPKGTIRKILEYIEQGNSFKAALDNDPIFPPMAQKLIETGETTGSLDSMFNEIASYYDEQLNVAIKAALSLVEPCLIVVMASLVGFIMLAVFIPLFKISFIGLKGMG